MRRDDLNGAYGNLFFVGKDDVTLGGKVVGAAPDLDSDSGCDQIAKQLVFHYNFAIAADAATPYRRMSCLSRAIVRRGDIPTRQGFGADRQRSVLRWTLQGERKVLHRELVPPFDKLPPPLHVVRSATFPGPRERIERSHEPTQIVYLTKDTARLVSLQEPGVEESKGDLEERLSWLKQNLSPQSQAVLTAEPDVTAQVVLAVLQLASDRYPMQLAPAPGKLDGRRLEPHEQSWLTGVGDGTKPFLTPKPKGPRSGSAD